MIGLSHDELLQREVARHLFRLSAPELAPLLLGKILARRVKGRWLAGMICETEAYTQEDPASHCYRGLSPRNRSMFAEPGTLYIYRSYGIHWCVNIKSGAAGHGEGVLLRALEPLLGFGLAACRTHGAVCAKQNRETARLCSGPGKLAKALAIDGSHDGVMMGAGEVFLFEPPEGAPRPWPVVRGERIGISRARELPLRFGFAAHPSLSRPFVQGASQHVT